MNPASGPSRHAAAVNTLWGQLRAEVLQPQPWFELACLYAAADLPWQAGYAARQAARLDASLGPVLQARGLGTVPGPAGGDAQLGRPRLDDADGLASRLSSWLAGCPGDWLSWLYLARLQDMSQTGGDEAAPAHQALARATALEPIAGESRHWIGVWRLNAGDAQGAVAALSALLDTRPPRFGSMMYLGEALARVGKLAAAEKAFTRASGSSSAEFLLSLAARVYAHNYWQEAIGILQKALARQPDSVPILLALARIQSEVYLLAECRQTLHRLRELAPQHPEARLLDAGLLGRMGDAKGHLASLQQAYRGGGDPLSRLASSIAMTSLYDDDRSPTEVAALHRALCAPIEAAVAPRTRFDNGRDPDRRLRIGLLTGDLHRQHPVNIFMLPVLQRLDHQAFDVGVYHTGTRHDAYTRQAQACADRWLEAAGLDDAALQQAILADRVDVLVDLAGHTATHRLGVLAMRAAPVQATFLGYPHSTGLSRIDWLIGDPTVSPAEHAALYSEGLAQLPHSVFCWAPVDPYPLPPPRGPEAPVVFGSFNNALKLSPTTLALWARILHAVPGALLMLKAPSLRDASVRAHYSAQLTTLGIAPERLLLQGPSGLEDMMQAYGELDIALDPVPYNGGTTSLQALWMGVPVVTRCGGNFVSRMGASFMRTLGEPAWVAEDADAYVAAAVRLTQDLAALRSGRPALRAQMAASPLCDIARYTCDLQGLLRRMWRAHCTGDGRRVLAA